MFQSRRTLQIAMAVLACVPLVTGLLAMMGIDDPLFRALNLPRDGALDSNMRFFAGVWFALGLAAAWLVPRIERETSLFRALWLMIFVGGIGRLLSMLLVGLPLAPFIGFTALEIVGAPFFVWWQANVARAARKGA